MRRRQFLALCGCVAVCRLFTTAGPCEGAAIQTTGNSLTVSIVRKAANVGMGLVRVTKFFGFQAEYEGSIPFTRSNVFSNLACERSQLPTNRAEHFRQSFHCLFESREMIRLACRVS